MSKKKVGINRFSFFKLRYTILKRVVRTQKPIFRGLLRFSKNFFCRSKIFFDPPKTPVFDQKFFEKNGKIFFSQKVPKIVIGHTYTKDAPKGSLSKPHSQNKSCFHFGQKKFIFPRGVFLVFFSKNFAKITILVKKKKKITLR